VSKKVLVVDDEQQIIDFLEHFLARFDIQVKKTAKSVEALEVCADFKPDCVFLDIQMPGQDGLCVLKEIRKRHPDQKVIMITGKEEKECQDRARKYGAIDYITKPLDLADLSAKIKEHVLGE